MKASVLLLVLLSHCAFAEKHSVMTFFAGFSGISNLPEFIPAAEVDGTDASYCVSDKMLKINPDLVKDAMQTVPDLVGWFGTVFHEIWRAFTEGTSNYSRQRFSQAKEKHSLETFSAGFSRIPNFPGFFAAEVDGTKILYINNDKKLKMSLDWIDTTMQFVPGWLKLFKSIYLEFLPHLFEDMVHSARQLFNHTEGVHVLQMIGGIEFDDETGDFDYVMKFGYDGEDFLSVDLMTLTLTFHKPEPTTEKVSLPPGLQFLKILLTRDAPHFLQMYVGTVKSSQPRTVLPSVSLLQRSPSSPVTCHATGFFPDRAVMFWRRDGEELQEEVYHGEILPNHNRTFQMSVKLNISSVPPEDWGKYEYVFQLFGEKEDMVTKLHKDVIRTNHAARHYLTTIIIVICAIIGVCGFIMARAAHKYRRAPHSESTLSPLNSLRD